MHKIDGDGFAELMLSWMGSELSDLYRRHVDPAPAGSITLGCTVWGEKYIDRFLNLTVKSLRGQMGALRGPARLLLFTDVAGFSALWKTAREFQADGVPAQIICVPDAIMAQMPKRPNNKYMALGATQNLSVQIAARHGTAFGALFPDVIYSENYFANLFRLAQKHHSIVHTGISADVSVIEEAKRYEKDGALRIGSVDLGDMGFRHLHGQSRANLVNRGKTFLGFPASHCTIWQARDRVTHYSCHTNPMWMPADLCAQSTVKFFSAIDCNLPYLLKSFYVPALSDDMVMLEVSDSTKTFSGQRCDMETFIAACWHITNFREDYLPYFAAENDVPIKPRAEGLDVLDIRTRHAEIVECLRANKDAVRGRLKIKEVA